MWYKIIEKNPKGWTTSDELILKNAIHIGTYRDLQSCTYRKWIINLTEEEAILIKLVHGSEIIFKELDQQEYFDMVNRMYIVD